MHIALFTSLKSVKVSDEKAADVVNQVEEHIAVKIKEATAALEAQIRALTWLIGTLGSLIAIGVLISALSPIIIKLVD